MMRLKNYKWKSREDDHIRTMVEISLYDVNNLWTDRAQRGPTLVAYNAFDFFITVSISVLRYNILLSLRLNGLAQIP
jgi:hypothetical protein